MEFTLTCKRLEMEDKKASRAPRGTHSVMAPLICTNEIDRSRINREKE